MMYFSFNFSYEDGFLINCYLVRWLKWRKFDILISNHLNIRCRIFQTCHSKKSAYLSGSEMFIR
jgi:hypothetical protein